MARHVDEGYWRIAAIVCTPLEIEFMGYHITRGMSYRQIGYMKGVAWETVRDRIKRGSQKVALAMNEEAA